MPSMYDDDSPEPAEPKRDKGEATALLPKDFFPGDKPLEPGNVCKVKIEKVYDDQVAVTYSHDRKDDDDDDSEITETSEVDEMMS